MKALRPFEISVFVYQSTRCHVPEDWNLWQHRSENLQTRKLIARNSTSQEIRRNTWIPIVHCGVENSLLLIRVYSQLSFICILV